MCVFAAESLPGHLMTNVLYAFIDPSEDATCTFTADHRPIFFNQFRNLKSKFPHLQVQLSLGGWTKSAKFSDIASTSPGRKSLAQSCVRFELICFENLLTNYLAQTLDCSREQGGSRWH